MTFEEKLINDLERNFPSHKISLSPFILNPHDYNPYREIWIDHKKTKVQVSQILVDELLSQLLSHSNTGRLYEKFLFMIIKQSKTE